MSVMASQITRLTIVYATVHSGVDQRKHQSSASLAFVRGIHRSPLNSPHKGPVTRKMFPFDDVIMLTTDVKCPGNRTTKLIGYGENIEFINSWFGKLPWKIVYPGATEIAKSGGGRGVKNAYELVNLAGLNFSFNTLLVFQIWKRSFVWNFNGYLWNSVHAFRTLSPNIWIDEKLFIVTNNIKCIHRVHTTIWQNINKI